MNIAIRFCAAVLAGMFVTVHPAFSQMRIKAADLMRAPQNYYMQQVVIEGEVISTEHSTGMFRGTYTLECNYGGQVVIESQNLPAIGYRIEATVTVKPGKDINSFRLEEVKRKRPGSFVGAIILSSMVIVLGIVMVMGLKNTSLQ